MLSSIKVEVDAFVKDEGVIQRRLPRFQLYLRRSGKNLETSAPVRESLSLIAPRIGGPYAARRWHL
jgi:hypothetical protein